VLRQHSGMPHCKVIRKLQHSPIGVQKSNCIISVVHSLGIDRGPRRFEGSMTTENGYQFVLDDALVQKLCSAGRGAASTGRANSVDSIF
jgi:hypothetical protein